MVERDGVNQSPRHLSSVLGWKIDASRQIGACEGGSRSLFVRLWISSVLVIKKPTPSREPFAFGIAYCLCSSWTLQQ